MYNLYCGFKFPSIRIFWPMLIRGPNRNLKAWVLRSIFYTKVLSLTFVFAVCKCVRWKMAKKVWVLAPTSLKSMGAEVPKAHIPMWPWLIEAMPVCREIWFWRPIFHNRGHLILCKIIFVLSLNFSVYHLIHFQAIFKTWMLWGCTKANLIFFHMINYQ